MTAATQIQQDAAPFFLEWHDLGLFGPLLKKEIIPNYKKLVSRCFLTRRTKIDFWNFLIWLVELQDKFHSDLKLRGRDNDKEMSAGARHLCRQQMWNASNWTMKSYLTDTKTFISLFLLLRHAGVDPRTAEQCLQRGVSTCDSVWLHLLIVERRIQAGEFVGARQAFSDGVSRFPYSHLLRSQWISFEVKELADTAAQRLKTLCGIVAQISDEDDDIKRTRIKNEVGELRKWSLSGEGVAKLVAGARKKKKQSGFPALLLRAQASVHSALLLRDEVLGELENTKGFGKRTNRSIKFDGDWIFIDGLDELAALLSELRRSQRRDSPLLDLDRLSNFTSGGLHKLTKVLTVDARKLGHLSAGLIYVFFSVAKPFWDCVSGDGGDGLFALETKPGIGPEREIFEIWADELENNMRGISQTRRLVRNPIMRGVAEVLERGKYCWNESGYRELDADFRLWMLRRGVPLPNSLDFNAELKSLLDDDEAWEHQASSAKADIRILEGATKWARVICDLESVVNQVEKLDGTDEIERDAATCLVFAKASLYEINRRSLNRHTLTN